MTFHQRLAIKLSFALVVGLGYGLWRWVGE